MDRTSRRRHRLRSLRRRRRHDTAVDVLGARGRLCLVAIHPQPREINLHRFFWRELTLLGARLYHRADFEKAVTLVADGTIPADRLISKIVPLTQAPAAFQALENGGDVMKILVDCTTHTHNDAAEQDADQTAQGDAG